MTCPEEFARMRDVLASTALTVLIAAGIAPSLSRPVQAADAKVPAALESHLNALTSAERRFIDDPVQLRLFGLTKEKLYNRLAGRDAAGVKEYVSALMSAVEEIRYKPAETGADDEDRDPLDPAGDMPAVPLNPEAGNFNASTVLRPAILDEYKRTPGPFSLRRYVNQADGIPTFANAPVAIRKADLVAGEVEVAFVGVPLNLGSGWRDSQHAPSVMRGMYGLGGYDISGGVDPSVALAIADYGDIAVDRMSIELSVDHIRDMVGGMVDAGVIPFVVGGDHSVMFPTVAAMVDSYGAGEVGVVHLDAHYRGARDLAHVYSDSQSVSRLLEEGLLDGENLVQVGLRGPEPDAEALDWMRDQVIRYHTMAEIGSRGWDAVASDVIEETGDGPDNVFISFDISVLDPAYATGAGQPVPSGLTMREVLPLVRRLCAETNVIGFEMLDVTPYLDLSYQTALNANYTMHACLTGIAMRKEGITDENHISPLAVDHGQ